MELGGCTELAGAASTGADAPALPARRAFAWAAALCTASGVVYVTIAWPVEQQDVNFVRCGFLARA